MRFCFSCFSLEWPVIRLATHPCRVSGRASKREAGKVQGKRRLGAGGRNMGEKRAICFRSFLLQCERLTAPRATASADRPGQQNLKWLQPISQIVHRTDNILSILSPTVILQSSFSTLRSAECPEREILSTEYDERQSQSCLKKGRNDTAREQDNDEQGRNNQERRKRKEERVNREQLLSFSTNINACHFETVQHFEAIEEVANRL